MCKREIYLRKSGEMFYTLISSFEQLFPGNDQVWGRLLLFLTLNVSFGRWGIRLLSTTTSLLFFFRVGDYGMNFSASYVVDVQVVSRDMLMP